MSEDLIVKVEKKKINLKRIIEYFIFNIKWLLIPFYLKLLLTLLQLLVAFYHNNIRTELLLDTLENVDIVMIANLIKLIISGSYNSFISKTHGYSNENNSSGILKVKITTSLMGICSISLLKNFLEIDKTTPEELIKKLFIFVFFILAAYVLAKIDYIHVQSEKIEEETEKLKHH